MKPEDITTNPRLAGLVKRYHTWITISTQSVAEHSWQVYRIYVEIFRRPLPNVCEYIMFHDLGEIVTGDLPYPIKARNGDLKKIMDKLEEEAVSTMCHRVPVISKEESARVRLCHMLEMMEFGLHEMTLGNQYARPVFERCQEAVHEMVSDMGDAAFRRRALGYVRSAERRLA